VLEAFRRREVCQSAERRIGLPLTAHARHQRHQRGLHLQRLKPNERAYAAVASERTTSHRHELDCRAAGAHSARHGARPRRVNQYSAYWETDGALFYERSNNAPRGYADVYLHEMPGGQYTNLKDSRGDGLGDRDGPRSRARSHVNRAFGISSSDAVQHSSGDMAVFPGDARHDSSTSLERLDENHTLTLADFGDRAVPGALQFRPRLAEDSQKNQSQGEKPGHDSGRAVEPWISRRRANLRRDRRKPLPLESSYLMYPDVFPEICPRANNYVLGRCIQRQQFFYGMQTG